MLYDKGIMSEFLDLLTNNALISTLICAAITGILTLLWGIYKDDRDSKAIVKFLTESATETSHTFRSTEAIASKTKLTQGRVEVLCAKHSKISRNAKEKQSWKLNL